MQYAGRAVRVLLDYVGHIQICSKLKMVLEKHKEWPEICDILGEYPNYDSNYIYLRVSKTRKRCIVNNPDIVQFMLVLFMNFYRKSPVTKAHVQADDQEEDDSKETRRPKNNQLCSIPTFT